MKNKENEPGKQPAPEGWRRRFARYHPADVVAYLAIVAGLAWWVFAGAGKLGYNWQWFRVPGFIGTVANGVLQPGPLMKGLGLTLEITAWSLLLAFCAGLVTALLRLSGSIVGRALARCYLEIVRNTPLLVQLFFIYFVISPIIGMSRFQSAVIALSMFEGAYISEIFRAGIVSIHRGQWEAAFSLGLDRWQTYRRVILPQALRRMLPPLTSQAVSLIKDSALVSTIAIFDLTMQGRSIISETYLVFEIWLTVAAIYLLLTGSLSFFVRFMEKQLPVAS